MALALTKDFRRFERYGVIMPPEDKDVALFPRRVGDYWAMIHRRVGYNSANIWLSYSPDLRHWGSNKLMFAARQGAWWDANKISLSPLSIETSQGWLVIYFPCGYTLASDGDTLRRYYGAADTSTALAAGSVRASGLAGGARPQRRLNVQPPTRDH